MKLIGRIIDEPIKGRSLQMSIEDNFGSVMKVRIDKETQQERFKKAQNLYL